MIELAFLATASLHQCAFSAARDAGNTAYKLRGWLG